MSDTQIPKPMLPLLALACAAGMLIVATTNTEALIAFGRELFGSSLDWSLPAMCIGYEFVAAIVLFATPHELIKVRRSAAIGAIVGFAATVLLAILWALIEGGAIPGGLWLKVVMKPFPSLIAAGLMHTFVLVWRAAKESAGVEKTAAPRAPQAVAAPSITPEQIAAIVANTVDAAMIRLTADFDAKLAGALQTRRPAARPRPAATPVLTPVPKPAAVPQPPSLEDITRRQQEAAVEAFQEELAALPEAPATTEPPAADDRPAVREPATRVADEHVTKMLGIRQQHGELKSGEARRYFPGLSDRTIRGVIQWAEYRESQGLQAAS